MSNSRTFRSLLFGILMLAAAGVRAETFWSTYYGKLIAFDLDFATGVAEYTMQPSGNPTGALSYLAEARHPLTGDLWVAYYNAVSGRQALGRLLPGSADPEFGVELEVYGVTSLQFSPEGTLYGILAPLTENDLILATIDTGTGNFEPILSTGTLRGFTGFAFHPLTGDLYLAGIESCVAGCQGFVDTLTIPQHVRTRVASWVGVEPGQPLFDEAGDLVLMMGNFYRIENGTIVYFSQGPTFDTAFGPLSYPLYEASPAEGTNGCVPTGNKACLQHRRIAVAGSYDAGIFGGPAGEVKPRLESDEVIAFSFFDPANLELFFKVIDGCSFNGHFWVYGSGLTNAGVSIDLTDSLGSTVYEIDRAPGQEFGSVADILAIPCEPPPPGAPGKTLLP